MSIEKTGGTAIEDLKGGQAGGHSNRAQAKNTWLRTPPPNLAKPFGSFYWPLEATALVVAICAALLFARVIDVGAVSVNWVVIFNVNVAVALIVVAAGIVVMVPKALKKPREVLNTSNVVSLVALLLVALYFLSGDIQLGPVKGIDLGTFSYTIAALDFNLLGSALLAVVLLCLAFRKSSISIIALLVLFLSWGFHIDGLNFGIFSELVTSQSGTNLLRTMVPPSWGYFSSVIQPMLQTIQTAIVATCIGIVGAVPLSMLASRNTTPHPVIYTIVRFFINTIRAVPALVLALLFITFVGLGPVPGALGLGLHTISSLTKLYAEAIESVKPEPIEALSASGANGIQRFRWGVFPQVFPLLVSSSIYYWESNTRDSTVVAFVGGGGIGFLLNQNLSLLDYSNVTVILVILVITVAALDRVSDFVRARVM
ncbi:MAG TPA: phosphonate ABC transporter, permease protein PhnE [Ktedonobacteraceae bacterium]|nr:phosphonate ABC transporter, permease protein PhnE [Ktedonobacteraceae bacterium]